MDAHDFPAFIRTTLQIILYSARPEFHENHDRFYGKTPRFACHPLLVWEKEERKTGDF